MRAIANAQKEKRLQVIGNQERGKATWNSTAFLRISDCLYAASHILGDRAYSILRKQISAPPKRWAHFGKFSRRARYSFANFTLMPHYVVLDTRQKKYPTAQNMRGADIWLPGVSSPVFPTCSSTRTARRPSRRIACPP